MPNHAQRRNMLRQQKVLRAKNELNPMSRDAVDFREAQRENGRKIHEANLDRLEQQNAVLMEEKLTSVKANWQSQGYNDEEIALLTEAWKLTTFKNKKTWHADKKTARKLMKQADESRKQRTQ
jgi:alkylhydroperoxidase family enzyme